MTRTPSTRLSISSCSWLLALLLIATAHADEPLKPLVQPNDRIAIFGDSISTGKSYGYKAIQLLNQEHPDLHLTWFDNGHPGWRSDHALKALDQLLADKPTLVTIMFGTNDLGQTGARGIAELHDHLLNLIKPIQATGARVILLTVPYTSDESPWGDMLDRGPIPRMGQEVKRLGKEMNLPVFDMYAAMKHALDDARKTDPKFQMYGRPGDVHPNDAGHQLMARALADFLVGKAAPTPIPYEWHPSNGPVASAARVQTPIDVLNPDAPFPQADPMVIDNPGQVLEKDRWKGPQDLSAKAIAAWDDKCLYVEVRVVDDVVMPGPKQPAWSYDGIEVFIDTRPRAKRDVGAASDYYQFLVPTAQKDGPVELYCGNQTPFDPSTAKASYRKTPDGYVLRWAIPWSAIKFDPTAPDAEIGLDFAINDKDDAKTDRYKILWRGAGDDFNDASHLGILKLTR